MWILMKTADFDKNHGFWPKLQIFDENSGSWWKLLILMKTTDFGLKTFSGRFKVRNCKKYISNSIFNRTTSNTEIHGFLSEMKDYLPKKVTPIFFISCTQLTLSRPYNLIFALCTQLTLFKTIWLNFITVYPFDYFQYHMTRFMFCIVYPVDSIQDPLTQFYIMYPIDSFQDHLT